MGKVHLKCIALEKKKKKRRTYEMIPYPFFSENSSRHCFISHRRCASASITTSSQSGVQWYSRVLSIRFNYPVWTRIRENLDTFQP